MAGEKASPATKPVQEKFPGVDLIISRAQFQNYMDE